MRQAWIWLVFISLGIGGAVLWREEAQYAAMQLPLHIRPPASLTQDDAIDDVSATSSPALSATTSVRHAAGVKNTTQTFSASSSARSSASTSSASLSH